MPGLMVSKTEPVQKPGPGCGLPWPILCTFPPLHDLSMLFSADPNSFAWLWALSYFSQVSVKSFRPVCLSGLCMFLSSSQDDLEALYFIKNFKGLHKANNYNCEQHTISFWIDTELIHYLFWPFCPCYRF